MAATAEGVFRICRGPCGAKRPIDDFPLQTGVRARSRTNRPRRWYCVDCHRERQSEYIRRCKLRLRTEVIQAYGGKCACCESEYLPHLTIDHIEGGGTEDRRQHTDDFYTRLRREGFPVGYQVLCFNRNFAKWSLGECGCSTKVVI